MSFKSSKIALVHDGELAVEGDLTIRDITRKVTFAVEGRRLRPRIHGAIRVGISAMTKINHKDFGLTWNATLETGGLLVGEEVTITIEAEFITGA